MVAVVAAVTPLVLHLIASELQGTLQGLVGHPPVAAVDVQIVRAVLQVDADRLGLHLADQGGVIVPAPQPHIGADGAEHAREGVGPLPGGSEGADGTAGGTADAAVVPLLRQHDGPAVGGFFGFHIGQELIQQETGVVIAQAIVFKAAVEAVQRIRALCLNPAMHDEHANGDGHLLLGDQPVKHLGRLVLDAILVHIHAGGRLAVILRRHIHPVIAVGPGVDLAVLERELQHLALGGLGHRQTAGGQQAQQHQHRFFHRNTGGRNGKVIRPNPGSLNSRLKPDHSLPDFGRICHRLPEGF